MTYITDHFSLDEMIASNTAERHGIANTPNPDDMRNLYALCGLLEQVRTVCGNHPVRVTSGYRSPQLNKLVGGSNTSAHMEGRAADFVVPKFGTPKDVTERIMLSTIEYDQIIWEGSWVHIAVDEHPRRQALVATFVDGIAKYTDWEWGQG